MKHKQRGEMMLGVMLLICIIAGTLGQYKEPPAHEEFKVEAEK